MRHKEQCMNTHDEMNREQLFFAVFCIEALADELSTTGDRIYRMLSEESDILDKYVIPCYDALHTQGRGYIVDDLKQLLREKGVLT